MKKIFFLMFSILLLSSCDEVDVKIETNAEKLKYYDVSLAFKLPPPDNNVRVYRFYNQGRVYFVAVKGIGVKNTYTQQNGKLSQTIVADTMGTEQ